MQFNVHTPERQPDETQAAHRDRRQASGLFAKRFMAGMPIVVTAGTNRRHLIKAAGGIRHFKRAKHRAMREAWFQD